MPLPALNATDAPKQKPNILFVITDDIGWGDFRCYKPDGDVSRIVDFPTVKSDVSKEDLEFKC